MFDSRERGMGRFFTGLARNRINRATAARGLDGEFILGMVLAIVVVVLLWWTPFLFPFRIFTTAAHEVSHSLSSIIMGGGAGDIKLFWNGGGVAQVGITGTLGAIVVYSAGYLGSVIFGGMLLLESKKATTRRRVLWAITGGLILVTAFFIRDVSSLIMVAIVAGLAGLAAYRAPNIIVTFIINVLALLSCLYSLMDLFFLIISNTNPFHTGFNDAVGLATYTGIPAIIWAVAWGLVGAFMMFMFLKRAVLKAQPSNGPATGPYSGPKEPNTFDRYDEYLSKK
ncbi:MAG: hypothetical protein JWP00_4985 [Chloroflexi bacterium]|jgi:hypothetical protein|nr:hypothetical protein [Chloroflexota bacterium]